jgi:hypothetical protein
MRKTDRDLGMSRDITRRDFIADAYTHLAIDEAFRAVQEFI